MHLNILKQKEGEALTHYLKWWMLGFKEVELVDDKMTINTFHNSL